MNTSNALGNRGYVPGNSPSDESQTKANPAMGLTQRLSNFFAGPNGKSEPIDADAESLGELVEGEIDDTPWQILFQAINFPGPEYIGLDILGLAVIGRSDPSASKQPDLDLSPFEAHVHGVSRRHAVLVPSDEGLCLIDLDSANGTWINGRYMSPGQKYRLRSGDTVEFGSLKLMIRVIGVTTRGLSINSTTQTRVKPLQR